MIISTIDLNYAINYVPENWSENNYLIEMPDREDGSLCSVVFEKYFGEWRLKGTNLLVKELLRVIEFVNKEKVEWIRDEKREGYIVANTTDIELIETGPSGCVKFSLRKSFRRHEFDCVDYVAKYRIPNKDNGIVLLEIEIKDEKKSDD